MNFGANKKFGTHFPVLIKMVEMTDGPILELGMGLNSSLFLHWACYLSKRKLVSYESYRECYKFFKNLNNEYHQVSWVRDGDWDKIDVLDHWSVVLVDHESDRRTKEIERLANSADYIIAHDSEGRNDKSYKYSQIYPLFKYRYNFTRARPHTVVLSNFKELSDLL